MAFTPKGYCPEIKLGPTALTRTREWWHRGVLMGLRYYADCPSCGIEREIGELGRIIFAHPRRHDTKGKWHA